MLLRGAERFSRDAALAVADPALDLAHPMKGPFKALPHGDWADQARAALDLARIAEVRAQVPSLANRREIAK